MTNIIHDTDNHRFTTTIDGLTAFISYVDTGETLIFDHTIVPNALGGRGIGTALVKHALAYAQVQGKKIVPACSFVAHYVQKHPEYQSLLHLA
ncbi:N-acetyltransferase [Moraxella haemolytica]|uniref:GNAT family N-acetyltransferase n=1 Tax=Moraxella TaxID=475 RepID=UPI002542D647|nr:GNAT family N-acetyltransferase [Moraxella sp. ZY171148]WII95153.1 N-acetyltransferase [Moraxella sp. ZY171148]